MPSVRYYNQSAPFWDFVASLEHQPHGPCSTHGTDSPWNTGFEGFPFGPRHRNGRDPHHRHHQGDPPPPPPPPPPQDDHGMTSGERRDHDPEAGPSASHGPPPPSPGHDHHRGSGPNGSRGRCGRGRGGWGSWGSHGPRGGQPHPMSGLQNLAELFQSQLFGGTTATTGKASDETFEPEVDVFDTPSAFVVHLALPGAKKEDVGVDWDAEKSELHVAGIIHRPGDEEFLATLALNERTVGVFDRKVRLGSRANPAQVDVEGITARMEDGVLRVEVPKMDGGFVEIRKVDVL